MKLRNNNQNNQSTQNTRKYEKTKDANHHPQHGRTARYRYSDDVPGERNHETELCDSMPGCNRRGSARKNQLRRIW